MRKAAGIFESGGLFLLSPYSSKSRFGEGDNAKGPLCYLGFENISFRGSSVGGLGIVFSGYAKGRELGRQARRRSRKPDRSREPTSHSHLLERLERPLLTESHLQLTRKIENQGH